MSSRFHQKYHRYNHHSVPPGTGNSVAYPDEGYDPIASFTSPFRGEFYSTGDIITTKMLSAGDGIRSSSNAVIHTSLTVGTDAMIGQNLYVDADAVIRGDLTVLGDTTTLQTLVYSTSAIDINNVGTGPALKVTQSGNTPVALFVDAEGSSVIIDNNSYVGIGTETPTVDLHIKRENDAEIKIQANRPIFTLNNDRHTFNITNEQNGTTTLIKSFSANGFVDTLNVLTLLSAGQVGVNTLTPNKTFSVNGELSAADTITAPRIVLTSPSIHIIQPTSSILLPLTAIDIELNTTVNTMVTSFVGGTKGLLYTLTNVGTSILTLTAASGSPKIYVRNGTAWRSNTYSLSTAFLQLPPNTSCSLRVGNGGIVSVW